MKSIQNKILLVVISGLLVITAVVSAIAVTMTHEIMHKDADRILNNVCQKEAAYLNDTLGDVEKAADVMELYATTEVGELNMLRDEAYCSAYLEKAKRMFVDVALNTNGLEGFFMRINPEYSDGTTGFYNVITKDGELREMSVTDLSKFTEDDIRNVGWYYAAVQAGKSVWMEPYYFPGHEEQMISYVLPMYVSGELLGVVGFDMNFQYLVNRINSIDVYERGYAVLLATDKITCYNEQAFIETHNQHTKATVALENGMYLELRADYKDIQKEIHPMLKKIIIAFVIVLIFSIVYTVFVTRRIVQPLKQLTHVAERISTGMNDKDLATIPIQSKDEVGTLSRVLVRTYDKIQEYTAYINALAYRDSLTGIKNSTAYAEAVKELNKDINCNNPKFGVLVADINNLKQTNDKYGHDIGNELIIHTATILTGIFKRSSIFRIGGDEFAVILKDTDYNNYRILLERMDEACSKDYITVCENRIPVSIARGVSLFNSSIDRVYEDVFSKADRAMYLHKEKCKQERIEEV